MHLSIQGPGIVGIHPLVRRIQVFLRGLPRLQGRQGAIICLQRDRTRTFTGQHRLQHCLTAHHAPDPVSDCLTHAA